MLKEELANHLKDAMRAKDTLKLSTLRLLQAALKYKEIDLGHELSTEEIVGVVKSQVKTLKDSLTSFLSAGRDDLVEKAESELEILKSYLPEEMSDDDLTSIVKEALKEIGAETKEDMGKAMGAAMRKVAGKADGGRVKEFVEKLLS